MRKYLLGVLAIAVFAVAAPAFAVHEANNQFDLAVVAGTGQAGSDGSGYSNFIKGGATGNGDGAAWQNYVQGSGLKANTMYTWVGIAMGTASTICSFTTDASGSGSCSSSVNSRLGSTEIREGGVGGVPVLRAVSSTDADNKVEDGEIERRGTCRFDDNPGCQAQNG